MHARSAGRKSAGAWSSSPIRLYHQKGRFGQAKTTGEGQAKWLRADAAYAKPAAPAEIDLQVDGKAVARTTVQRKEPAAFTASETFDVGMELGLPVVLGYFYHRPIAFTGGIEMVKAELL
jgi:hypothetical protein